MLQPSSHAAVDLSIRNTGYTRVEANPEQPRGPQSPVLHQRLQVLRDLPVGSGSALRPRGRKYCFLLSVVLTLNPNPEPPP